MSSKARKGIPREDPVPDSQVCTSMRTFPVTMRRYAAVGGMVESSKRVIATRLVKLDDSLLPFVSVSDSSEYEVGCKLHRDCKGHLCVTPSGVKLMPSCYATSTVLSSNSYAAAAHSAMERWHEDPSWYYRESLKRIFLTKKGDMRAPLAGGYVQGSCRFVLSPCWDALPGTMALPSSMFFNFSTVDEGVDEEGIPTNRFVERRLLPGDMGILVRPPSNSLTNALLVKCFPWSNTTIGVNPADLKKLRGDFDGDEGEFFVLSKKKSLEGQKEAYMDPGDDEFIEPAERIRSLTRCHMGGQDFRKLFMRFTTVSLQDLLDGKELPVCYKEAGGKPEVTKSFLNKMRDKDTERGYVRECLRGIRDVSEQQLTQGVIGDMARQARLAASCVRIVVDRTHAYVVMDTRKGTEVLDVPRSMCTGLHSRLGNACMRVVDSLCSVAQQTALDAHKASRAEAPKYDMVSALLQGDSERVLIGTSSTASGALWSHTDESTGIVAALVTRQQARLMDPHTVLSCTDPEILTRVESACGRKRVYECAFNATHFLSNYYGKRVSDDDVCCFVALMCYSPSSSPLPITHKEGCVARDIRPMTAVFANHFAAKASISLGSEEMPFLPCTTVTERTAFFAPPRF